MKRIVLLLIPALTLLVSSLVVAQDTATTVDVSESPELGSYLTDSEGMTLYLFTNDTEGVSNCSGDCLVAWPPYLVEADAELTLPDGVEGTLGTITRDDDTTQVTYNGWPLYHWASDMAAGDTNGHGVGEVWFVVAPGETTEVPGASPEASPAASPAAMGDTTVLVSETAELGEFLTDGEGMTLYLFTNDTEGVSACDADCAANWPPFEADEPLTLPEGVTGELTLIDREDGTQQVAYNGVALYYFANDAAAGDTSGEGVGDVWFVVPPES